MKVLIYYHNDMDGKCSAAIVKRSIVDKAELEFVPLVYGDEIELPTDIWNYWRVYILDFTLPERQMDELCTLFPRTDIIWIDHHISQLKKYKDKYSHFEGIREDGTAASELTWKFMHGEFSEIPQAVKFIADMDLWKLEDQNTLYFYEWAITNVKGPEDHAWKSLLESKKIDFKILERGLVLRRARLRQMVRDIDRISYETELDGYKVLKANYSSLESVSDAGNYICDRLGYDIAWLYYIKKNNKGNLVKMHSLRSRKDIDVSEIAVRMGGGGHKKAAGYVEYL